MNARVVKRLLTRKRQMTFFGRRSLLTATFSLSAIPEPYPAFTPPGKPMGIMGWFERMEGKQVITQIRHVTGRVSPPQWNPADPTRSPPYFAESEKAEDGTLVWNWWEGIEEVYSPGTPDRAAEVFVGGANLQKAVSEYRARDNWMNKWFYSLPEVSYMDRLSETSGLARSTHVDVRGAGVHVYWTVKCHAVWVINQFAASAARAVKAFNRAGVPIRLS